MSDDFDKQDDDFDWLSDDDDNASSTPSSDSGLTGQLSWLQENDNAPDADTGRSQTDDLDLDWLDSGDGDGESNTPASGDATGVTGQLTWLSDDNLADSPDAPEKGITDALDWMKGDDDNDVADEHEEDADAAPSWLSDTGPLVRDDDPEQAPDWLSSVGDTGMLNRDDINQALDDVDDDIDTSPDWLRDTGSFSAASLERATDYDSDVNDDQPDWLTNMGIGQSSSPDFDSPAETDDTGESDWLSGITPASDQDDDNDMSGLARLFDDMDDDPPVAQSDEEQVDTGWLDYDGDDDANDDYDPYAIYDDFEDGDDEYEDIFSSTGVSDGDTDSLFESDIQAPDASFGGDDSPDWLTEFDDETFERETGPLVDESASDEPTGDTDWLDSFDEDEFAGDTGSLAEEDIETPASDTDWLNQTFDDPEPEADYGVPDWLQGEPAAQGETDFLASDAPEDLPEMTADDLLSDLGFDPNDRPSTGLTGDLDAVDDDFDLNMFDDLGEGAQPTSTGLTGDLDAVDDDFDLNMFDDLGEGAQAASTGLTGDLDAVDDDFDLNMFDDLGDLTDDSSTGLTGDLAGIDDGLLDDLDFEDLGLDVDDVATGLTGELGDLEDDLDMSFLDDVQVDDDAPERMGTGLTGELGNLDDDLDMSFLDDVQVDDDAPERMGTGLTGELSDLDEDLDMSFLDDIQVDDEPEPAITGITGDLDSADDDMDLSFLDNIQVDDEPEPATGITGDLDFADDDIDLSFLDDVEETATGFTSELESADEELDLSFLDDEPEDDSDNWFDDSTTGDTRSDEPDWMKTLTEVEVTDVEMEAAEAEVDDIFDSLDLDDVDFDKFEEFEEEIDSPAADLDTLLASYDDIEEGEFDVDNVESGIDNLDAIFDDALSEDTPMEEEDLQGDIPEWLRGLDVGGDESSAAAIIRQQEDKPLEDLDDRLQALREKGISAGASIEADTSQSTEILSEVGDALVAPSITRETSSIVTDITLTDDQKKQADLLQQIVGITMIPTAETDEDGIPMVESSRRRRSLPKIGLARLAVALITLLVIILPFVSNFGIGSLPPLAFGGDNQSANVVFNQIENLNPGDYVLVGFEYGTTAAGELDSVSDILLRHIFSQGAIPIIVSSNPVGIVHAQNILDDIDQSVAGSLSLVANDNYYIARYLAGGTLGLRDLSQNFNSVVNINVQGEVTNLNLTSLDDMALMVLIAERSDDIRSWAEQIAPSTSTRLVGATGYSAQPLAEPYVDQTDGILGLIVGYRDAFTYGEMLQAVYATPTLASTETFTPTFTATNTPEATNTPLPTDTPEPEVTEAENEGEQPVTLPDEDDDTVEDTEPTDAPTEANTNTPVPTDTPEPTNTPTATATATNTALPTDTPTDAPTFTPTPRLITVIVVNAPGGAVNVRTGPSQNFPFLAAASDGDVYQVIGENEEGDWINFLLPDGREGWIAAFLVEKIELPETDFEGAVAPDDSADAGGGDVTVMQVQYQRRLGKNQVRFYQQQEPTVTGTPPTATPTLIPSATFTPSPTATVTFTPSPTPDPRAAYVFTRDRSQETSRLNAITLGTIAAIIIILFGNIYFGLQALIQRRRESKR